MAGSLAYKFGESPLFTADMDRIPVYDNTTKTYRGADIGSGLSYNTATNTLTGTGGTNTLLTGSGAGQSIYGASSGVGTGFLSLNADVLGQGFVYFSNAVWGEALSSFTIGSTTPGSEYFNVYANANGYGGAAIVNSNAGTSKSTVLYINTSTNLSGVGVEMNAFPANYTTAALQNKFRIFARSASLILDTESGNPLLFYVTGTEIMRIGTQLITIADNSNNIALGTSTGTKLGTAANQKLGLWGTTANVQPTNAITAAAFVANTSGIVNDTATFGGYTLGQIVAALKRLGALA